MLFFCYNPQNISGGHPEGGWALAGKNFGKIVIKRSGGGAYGKRNMEICEQELPVKVLPIDLQRAAVTAIVEWPIPCELIGSQSLKQGAL